MSTAYLDASALVKLFKPEAESSELAGVLAGHQIWTSAEIVVIEAVCTARRFGGEAMVRRARAVASRLELLPLTAAVRSRALTPFARTLRSLDATHAATVLSIARQLEVVVVYDVDLAAVLSAEGLRVTAPGTS